MTTSKERVLERERQRGRQEAQVVQQAAAGMSGTELNRRDSSIPDFQAAKKSKNMLEREVGFLCLSSAGRVVKLLQKYDSTIYTAEPEELPAQWGFVWSKDPEKAKPFVAISTSPYNKGECCTDGGKIYRSKIDNNVWQPTAYPQGWQDVATEGTTEPEPEPQPEVPTAPEFQQPTGGHDAYKKGDRVTYNGKVYESKIDANVYSPDAYPQGWEEIK